MFGIFKSRDSDSNSILTNNAEIENEIFNSTCLKIQTEKGEVEEVSVGEERRRERGLARLVSKTGEKRVRTVASARHQVTRLRDIFTSLVELGWCLLLSLVTASYVACWSLFALLWYCLAAYNGDLSDEGGEVTPCVLGVDSLMSSLLFSVELQQTIGFGSRVPTDHCSNALILQCLQSLLGLLLDSVVMGVVFAKIARPGRRGLTVVFSKNAVITRRDGLLHLIFQVGDIQVSRLVETHFRAQLRSQFVTEEGEVLHHYMRELSLTTQSDANSPREDRGLMLLPVQVTHVITEDSPLYAMDPRTLLHADLEIILAMEAVVEPSGNTTQVLTSYLPDEILWGWTFQSNTEYDRAAACFRVDVNKINSVAREDYTPRVSAREMRDSQSVV